MSNFVIWKYHSNEKTALALNKITGFDKTYRLNNGTPLSFLWPQNVSVLQNPDFPDDITLLDNVLNLDMIQVVSQKVKEFLITQNLTFIEWLPIQLLDVNSKVLSSDYFIMHVTQPVDAVDRQNSVFEMCLLDENDFDSFEKLVLDESKIPAGRSIFRLKGFSDWTFVRRDLAEKITQQGFTGIIWSEV